MGHCLIVYDISHDRTRTKVADTCLDYGLDRIQYSAFMGKLIRTHQEELMLKLKRQLGTRTGNIQLYPICDKDWRRRQVILREEHDGSGGEQAEGHAGDLEPDDEQVWEADIDDEFPF